MATITQDLYASAPHPLPFAPALDIRAFVLPRAAGNLLVYSSPTVADEASAVYELGGISDQYLNHSHEAGFGVDRVTDAFGTRLLAHERERAAVEEHARVSETFTERSLVGDDFELIPTPGHTPGATAFLWDSGHRRYLFTGDTIYLAGGEWIAAVLGSSDRATYLDSLELLRVLEFDLLVPWAATGGQPYMAPTDPRDTRRRIDAIIARLRRGEDR